MLFQLCILLIRNCGVLDKRKNVLGCWCNLKNAVHSWRQSQRTQFQIKTHEQSFCYYKNLGLTLIMNSSATWSTASFFCPNLADKYKVCRSYLVKKMTALVVVSFFNNSHDCLTKISLFFENTGPKQKKKKKQNQTNINPWKLSKCGKIALVGHLILKTYIQKKHSLWLLINTQKTKVEH